MGIICRDECGNLLDGIARAIRSVSPIQAEAIAMRDVVVMAESVNWENAIFESDNLSLIRACNGELSYGEIGHFVADITEWKKKYKDWVFTWTKREGNQAAHQLAALRKNNNLPLNWIGAPPMSLATILQHDKQVNSQNF